MDYLLADMCMKGLARIQPLKDGEKLLALLRRQLMIRAYIKTFEVCGISDVFDSYLNLYDNTKPTRDELANLRPTTTITYSRN